MKLSDCNKQNGFSFFGMEVAGTVFWSGIPWRVARKTNAVNGSRRSKLWKR